MHVPKRNAEPTGKAIYTLAQIGTNHKHLLRKKPPKLVKGEGTDTFNAQALYNRAKKKTISQSICLHLIEVAHSKGKLEMVQAYRNTYYCQNRVIGAGGKLYGDYCKNRFCSVCCGIRKAELINKYLPIVKTWADPHFVTLTAKAVPAKQLKGRMKRMGLSIAKLLARNKKRAQRDIGIKLQGIRSLECNFNPMRRTYNPHLHLIVDTKEGAELIVREWLEQCTSSHASAAAQFIRRVEDAERDLIEVIKYGSKVFTDPTMKKRAKRKVSPYIYISAFDNIITAMQGLRIFERFGFNLPPQTRKRKFTPLTIYEELHFDPQQHDWVNPETEALLTSYKPHPELLEILNNNIDTKAE